ncbi:MAG: sel1 repeat family protein [Janthinobacterium lividum]
MPEQPHTMTDREFHALEHPSQKPRFVLALLLSIILFPLIAIALVAGTVVLLVPLFGLMIWIGGRVFFSRFLGNSILVSSVNYPRINEIAEELKTLIGYQKTVYIFVYEQGNFNAFLRKFFFFHNAVFLNSELLESGVSDNEVRWVIGRFVGYLRARRQAGFLGWIIRAAQKLLIFNFFLMPYERAMVYTGDRLALASIDGDISSAVSAFQKLMVGRQLGYTVNPEGIINQQRMVKGSFFAFLARVGSRFPHSTSRYVDMIVFAKAFYPVQFSRFETENPGLPEDLGQLAASQQPLANPGAAATLNDGSDEQDHGLGGIAISALVGLVVVSVAIAGGVIWYVKRDHQSADSDYASTPTSQTAGSNGATDATDADSLSSQGDAALAQKNYALAVSLYGRAAQHGEAGGENGLGYLYSHGLGVTQDYGLAAKWYTQAAAQGNRFAQNNLGWLYQNGYGVTRNYQTAASWFYQSASQGNAVAQTNLGYLYQSGLGVTQSFQKAATWYSKAATQGNADAANDLSYLYQNGLGVTQDQAQADYWKNKASAAN